VVGFTIGSKGKIPGKTCEKKNNNNNNNNNKYGGRVGIGFIWLRIRFSGGLL
jgi:hypothetical protein